MIISASRRTDIPKFYSEWFMNRIREGYAAPVNPFNREHYVVLLNPGDVIVFWTRDASKIIGHLDELDKSGFKYYFQYTITGYPRELERSTPSLDNAIRTFSELSDKIGAEKVVWRYDPILVTVSMNIEWHKENFRNIAQQLRGKTKRLVISFTDFYKKTERNLGVLKYIKFLDEDKKCVEAEVLELCRYITDFAKNNGIEKVQTCAERKLDVPGLETGKCIDDELIEQLFGFPCSSVKDKTQRKACGCITSRDIGAENSCLHGCRYCYATLDHEKAKEQNKLHNPVSPCLIGTPAEDEMEKIKERLEKTKKDKVKKTEVQASLF